MDGSFEVAFAGCHDAEGDAGLGTSHWRVRHGAENLVGQVLSVGVLADEPVAGLVRVVVTGLPCLPSAQQRVHHRRWYRWHGIAGRGRRRAATNRAAPARAERVPPTWAALGPLIECVTTAGDTDPIRPVNDLKLDTGVDGVRTGTFRRPRPCWR